MPRDPPQKQQRQLEEAIRGIEELFLDSPGKAKILEYLKKELDKLKNPIEPPAKPKRSRKSY